MTKWLMVGQANQNISPWLCLPTHHNRYVSIYTTQQEAPHHRVGRVLSFCFRRRSWDSPNPLPAGEFAPLFGTRGRGTLAGERGGGRVPIPTRRHTVWDSIYVCTLYSAWSSVLRNYQGGLADFHRCLRTLSKTPTKVCKQQQNGKRDSGARFNTIF